MAAWRYLFWDWGLTRQIDALPLQSPTMTWEINSAGTITAQIPLIDPELPASRVLAATSPLKTRVYCEQDGKLAWGGRITEPRTYDSTTGTLTINGEETVGYFAERYVPTLKLYGHDQVAIAEQVLAAMQGVPGGDAQLAVTAVDGMSGVLRDGVYSRWDFTPGLQALTDLTEMEAGFEFASRVQWNASGVPYEELLIAYPYLGRRRTASPLVIEYNKFTGGGNCLSYQWPDGPGLAVRTYTSGTTPDGVQLVAWTDSPALIDAGYPLIEQKVDVTSSKPTTQAALQQYANRAAGWAAGERVAAQFTLKAGAAMNISMFGAGDDVLVRITDYRFPAGPGGQPGFAGWMRIGHVQCTPQQNGLEVYVLTMLDYTEPVLPERIGGSVSSSPEPLVRQPGSRLFPHPPHIARAFKAAQRAADDLRWQTSPSVLHPVAASVTAGQPCTAASMTDVYRMYVYRDGAAVFADVAAGCGAGSVVSAQIACADYSLTGTPVTSAAGGERLMRLEFDLPDAWQPGDAHYVTVQAMRASGIDATTLQVVRGWQR